MPNFYNFPKSLRKTDYQELCNLVVASFRNNPNIKSLYLAGKEWVPGISDLDIIIVYNNRIKNKVGIPSPWSLSEKAKYIFSHNYGSYNKESFRNFYYLNPDKANLRLLWGEDIPIRHPHLELSSKDYRFLNTIIIFDLLINKLLFYPRYLITERYDVRRLLGELHSITYTLEMIKVITGERIGDDFSIKINQLRNNWFLGNQEKNLKQLTSLTKNGINLILDIVSKLNDFIERQSLPIDDGIIFRNRKFYIIFNKKWSKEKFLQSFRAGYITIRKPFSRRVIDNFKLVLPSHLSYFLMAYANFGGPLSDWIKEGLFNYKKQNNFIVSEGIKKHVISINNLVQASIDNNDLFKIPFPYGLIIGKRSKISKIGEKFILFLRSIKK